MKHLKPTLKTYVYRHCNIYNILIYFYNIDVKHLHHTTKMSEILETYAYAHNMLLRMRMIPVRARKVLSVRARDGSSAVEHFRTGKHHVTSHYRRKL
jgi:hypothetical protein